MSSSDTSISPEMSLGKKLQGRQSSSARAAFINSREISCPICPTFQLCDYSLCSVECVLWDPKQNYTKRSPLFVPKD